MEKKLHKCLDEVAQSSGVMGSLLADEQGLCLAAKGKMSCGNSGIVTAVAEQASLLDPGCVKPPVVILETDHRQLYVHKNGKLTIAVQKQGCL